MWSPPCPKCGSASKSKMWVRNQVKNAGLRSATLHRQLRLLTGLPLCHPALKKGFSLCRAFLCWVLCVGGRYHVWGMICTTRANMQPVSTTLSKPCVLTHLIFYFHASSSDTSLPLCRSLPSGPEAQRTIRDLLGASGLSALDIGGMTPYRAMVRL